MDRSVAALEGLGKPVCVVGVEGEKRCTFDRLPVARVLPARDHNDFMSVGDQMTRQVSSNKSRPTGNRNFHKVSFFTARTLGWMFAG